MAFELPPLPYAKNALEPHMSTKTLEFHYGKHHQAYVTTLNKLLADSPLGKGSLESVIKTTAKDETKAAIFNNAAQIWNHTFFWNCMKPAGGGQPTGAVAHRLERSFGGFGTFQEKFKEAATTQFGSGWAWLVLDGDQLKIIKTANAMTPLAQGQTALLACDVWEHAYYLDYQNRRPDFVQAFLDKLVNWAFVASNLAEAGQISKAS
jgi:Fe-Mn family superoxide dismutase